MKLLINLTAVLLIRGCHPVDYSYIQERLWSYESGVKIDEGDFINFYSSGYEMKDDTILFEGHPRAVIYKLDKKSDLLFLKKIPSDSIGIYYFHNYYE